MKSTLIALVFLAQVSAVYAQQKSVQERLGYEKDAKLVVIHADDIGVSHSENMATFSALEKGIVKSGSIMVPCPWFPEAAKYAREHPGADLGLHLTLNSEWNYYKWSPVAGRSAVPSLVDSAGFFYSTTAEVVANATPADVEKELRAQIEQALAFGVDVTHFDSHMGTIFAKKEFAEVYLKLGREYKVPVLINAGILQSFFGVDVSEVVSPDDVQFDYILSAGPENFDSGKMSEFYSEALKGIQSGLTYFILHAAYENDEMTAMTIEHPHYAADWRQIDYNFFTSKEAAKIIADENIKVVTMREIRDKVLRK